MSYIVPYHSIVFHDAPVDSGGLPEIPEGCGCFNSNNHGLLANRLYSAFSSGLNQIIDAFIPDSQQAYPYLHDGSRDANVFTEIQLKSDQIKWRCIRRALALMHLMSNITTTSARRPFQFLCGPCSSRKKDSKIPLTRWAHVSASESEPGGFNFQFTRPNFQVSTLAFHVIRLANHNGSEMLQYVLHHSPFDPEGPDSDWFPIEVSAGQSVGPPYFFGAYIT
ncbi:hypothetical protein C8R45DRAFT_945330 [Mycena sanguinolenta]|nr:hypothetical protein C8R45DRAFT_945330 [Mycena sanguinolenta]